MKQFSIIIPVYNEPDNIIRCLESIAALDYEKNLFEVIVVNDHSTDHTRKNIEKYIKGRKNFRLINNKKNLGRMKTRLAGAKNSKYQNLLFVDSRVTIHKDTLKVLDKRQEKVIIAGDRGYDFNRSIYDTFFYLIRKKVYHPNYPQKEEKVKINRENFGKIPKGTTSCLFDKEIFLKSMKEMKDTGKHTSDDTKLFFNTLKLTKFISRDNAFKIMYYNRTGLLPVVRHLFQRGPLFVDYYLKHGSPHFGKLLMFYFLIFSGLTLTFFSPQIIKYAIFLILALFVAIPLYLAENLKQFFICMLFVPIIGTSFALGLIYGLLIKSGKTISNIVCLQNDKKL